jgi:hypothetical protein
MCFLNKCQYCGCEPFEERKTIDGHHPDTLSYYYTIGCKNHSENTYTIMINYTNLKNCWLEISREKSHEEKKARREWNSKNNYKPFTHFLKKTFKLFLIEKFNREMTQR